MYKYKIIGKPTIEDVVVQMREEINSGTIPTFAFNSVKIATHGDADHANKAGGLIFWDDRKAPAPPVRDPESWTSSSPIKITNGEFDKAADKVLKALNDGRIDGNAINDAQAFYSQVTAVNLGCGSDTAFLIIWYPIFS